MFDFLKKYRQRALEMEKIASGLEMSYRAKDDLGTINLLRDFQLFRKGGRKRIKNLMQKKEEFLELNTSILDYQYTISTGNSSRTFRQTVFFIQCKKMDLPQFLLKPEHFFHRIGSYLGMQDIDFESHPEFSDQYLLQGSEEELIRKKLDTDFRSFFTIEKNWHLEGLNYFLILYRKNKLIPPEEIPAFYKKGKEIYSLFVKRA